MTCQSIASLKSYRHRQLPNGIFIFILFIMINTAGGVLMEHHWLLCGSCRCRVCVQLCGVLRVCQVMPSTVNSTVFFFFFWSTSAVWQQWVLELGAARAHVAEIESKCRTPNNSTTRLCARLQEQYKVCTFASAPRSTPLFVAIASRAYAMNGKLVWQRICISSDDGDGNVEWTIFEHFSIWITFRTCDGIGDAIKLRQTAHLFCVLPPYTIWIEKCKKFTFCLLDVLHAPTRLDCCFRQIRDVNSVANADLFAVEIHLANNNVEWN